MYLSNQRKLNRTNICSQLDREMIGEEATVAGWVQRTRDHGGLLFVDLRDRSGLVQLVFSKKISAEALKMAERLGQEDVIAVKGLIRKRPEENINREIATGEIEIMGEEIELISPSETPPFLIEDKVNAGEDLRLEYRYLDLRRPEMLEIVKTKHQTMQAIRGFLSQRDYWEVETPILTRSTPEGARDYLVPSRLHRGKFYALPQSPQLFKQVLMASGVERYFQIARCFRDEDLRANRQPEFTQIDIEVSFIDLENFQREMEELMREIFSLKGISLPREVPRLSYREVMDRFGSDSPDTRFGLEINDLSGIFADSEFRVFSGTIADGGTVRGIRVPGGAEFSRSQLDRLEERVKEFGAKGLAWLVFSSEEVSSPIAKFLSEKEFQQLREKLEITAGDLLLIVAADYKTAVASLGQLRLDLGCKLDLIPEDSYDLLWVEDFPLFTYNEEEERFEAEHHPFTAPLPEDIELLEENPAEARAAAYDLVLNGEEIGGGSIRINNRELQSKIFSLLNMSEEEAEEKFGFLLKSFSYGTPPHGGIAFGLDRIIMLLTGRKSVRDVIAFPKTQRATSPMTKAPGTVSPEQLKELNLKTISPEEE